MIRSTRLLHKLCTSAARSPLFSPVAAANHRFSTVTSSLVKESTETLKNSGNFGLIAGLRGRRCIISFRPHGQVTCANGENNINPFLVRSFASKSSRSTREDAQRKDISTVEDPFDSPTYNIPEKLMTFTEGASYSLVILAGLGIAGLAGYGVFKELIFEPKEYKVFGKALHRIQTDNRISVRIGSPITGYGQQSRNRAARQRIPNRAWKDEDGVEHIEVNFYIRGPHGDGKVYSEMFKDKEDKQWKFMYLMVEITSPSPAKILLESHLPA